MMRSFTDDRFHAFHDRDSRALFQDVAFHNCYFQGCGVSITKDPTLRSTVRNVQLFNCSQRGCTIRCAVIEDVLVDGFKTHGQLLQMWAPVFRHVTLRGRIGRVMISDLPGPTASLDLQASFAKANDAYYNHVDWALDISAGEFSELDLRGVPGHLVRRDPETQFLIYREKAMEGRWRNLEFRHGVCQVALQLFLKQNHPSLVLIAEKRSSRFRDKLADLQLLRAEGIAEAD